MASVSEPASVHLATDNGPAGRPPGLEVATGHAGRFHPLGSALTLIGRARSCDVRATVAGISHVHCVIVRQAAEYLVRDLESRSGTFVNGRRVSEAVLQSGDELVVGPLSLRVWLPDCPPAAPPESSISSDDAHSPVAAPAPAADATPPAAAIPSLSPEELSQQLRDELAELARRETRLHAHVADFEAETRKQRMLLNESVAAARTHWKELAAREAALQDQAARLKQDESRLREQAQSLAEATRRYEARTSHEEADRQARDEQSQQLCASLESQKAELETAIRRHQATLAALRQRLDGYRQQDDNAFQVAVNDLFDVGAALAGPLVHSRK